MNKEIRENLKKAQVELKKHGYYFCFNGFEPEMSFSCSDKIIYKYKDMTGFVQTLSESDMKNSIHIDCSVLDTKRVTANGKLVKVIFRVKIEETYIHTLFNGYDECIDREMSEYIMKYWANLNNFVDKLNSLNIICTYDEFAEAMEDIEKRKRS